MRKAQRTNLAALWSKAGDQRPGNCCRWSFYTNRQTGTKNKQRKQRKEERTSWKERRKKKGRQTGRQRDRPTDRQTDRQIETNRWTERRKDIYTTIDMLERYREELISKEQRGRTRIWWFLDQVILKRQTDKRICKRRGNQSGLAAQQINSSLSVSL